MYSIPGSNARTKLRYDSRGNITYKSDVGTYSYDSTRPDRLKSIATTTASGAQIAVTGTRAITYTWDDALAGAQSVAGVALGNGDLQLMVSRDAVNNRNLYTRQTYTSFNMPSQIARGAMNGTAEGRAVAIERVRPGTSTEKTAWGWASKRRSSATV